MSCRLSVFGEEDLKIEKFNDFKDFVLSNSLVSSFGIGIWFFFIEI